MRQNTYISNNSSRKSTMINLPNQILDNKDEQILELLKEDASLSTYQISKKTLIPQTTVLNRIRKLKVAAIIKKYTVEIDYKMLGKKVKAIIYVKVNKSSEKPVHGKTGIIEEQFIRHPLVVNVKRLMGHYDFMIEVVCKDIDELNQFLIEKVRSLDSIGETETIVVLNEWNK